jgi:hypothetical protein
MEISLKKLDQRIKRSKRTGKIALVGVGLVSLACGSLLIQGLLLAREAGHPELMWRTALGLVIVVGVDLFSLVFIRRQHRLFDEARKELTELIEDHPAF